MVQRNTNGLVLLLPLSKLKNHAEQFRNVLPWLRFPGRVQRPAKTEKFVTAGNCCAVTPQPILENALTSESTPADSRVTTHSWDSGILPTDGTSYQWRETLHTLNLNLQP